MNAYSSRNWFSIFLLLSSFDIVAAIQIEIPNALQAQVESQRMVQVASSDSLRATHWAPSAATAEDGKASMDVAAENRSNPPERVPLEEAYVMGQVVDQSTNMPLASVAILFEDTAIGTITDAEGRYKLGPAPAGSYTLTFVKTGFLEANITDFKLESGTVHEFAFALPPRPAEMSDEVFELQDFTVTAQQANEMMMKLDLIANSAAALSVMTAEDFSKYAASDIGDAVKRVSGVSVEGGKYAVIRGLGDRYVATTMNGLPIASPDPDRLAVQLDMFPTSLFSSVEVSKTFTPDQQGTSTGGINLGVNPIPEDFFLKLSVSAGLNSNVQGNNNYLRNRRATSRDRWAMAADKRAFPGGAAEGPFPNVFDKTINDQFATILPALFISQADFDAGVAELSAISESVGIAKHNYGENSDPNHGLKFSFGDVYNWGNSGPRMGYSFGLNYSGTSEFIENTDYFRSYVEPGSERGLTPKNFVNPGVATGYHRALLSESTTTSTLSLSAVLGLELSDEHRLSFSALDLNVSEDINARLDARGASGVYGRYYQAPFRGIWEPDYADSILDYDADGDGVLDTASSLDYQIQESLRYVERGLKRVQLSGEHTLEVPGLVLGDMDINWALSSDHAKQDEPGYLQTRGIISSAEGDFTLSTNSTASATPEPSYLIWRGINDEKDSRKLDFTFYEDHSDGLATKVKLGVLGSDSRRTVFDEFLELEYISDVVPVSENTNAPMSNFDGLVPTGYAVAADVDLVTKSTAKYLMLDHQFEGASCFRFIAGYRHENNSADVRVNRQTILRGAGFNNPFENQPLSGGYNKKSFLPSATIICKSLDEKFSLRASYSQTVALPSAREVSPYASSELAGTDVEVGNLSLQPSKVKNWDMGWSYNNDTGDYLSVGIFKKRIADRIERIAGLGADSSDSDDYDDYQIFASSQNIGAGLYSWYNNPDEATLKGFEIEFRKGLGFSGLEDLSIGGSFTRISGKVDRFPVEVAAKDKAGVLVSEEDLDNYRSRQLTQQPSEIFSGDLTYENEDLGLRVSLIAYHISDVLKGTSLVNSYDVFEESYSSFDLTLSKRINDHLKFGFTAKNLTNSSRGTYYESVSSGDQGLEYGKIQRDKYKKGRVYSVSFSYEY
ncbi:MAG: TonB-dependent receptor domain-containing protein [Opitutales bacterium]